VKGEFMVAHISAPLLKRIKSWQLVCLGVSGWLALYSAAMINWTNWSGLVGNAQGGCFATVMTLAGVEVKRFKRRESHDHLEWIKGLTTVQINSNLAQLMQRQDFRVETPSPVESQAGFGVRAVNAGRTIVFETARWDDQIIDLEHTMSTEDNRRKVLANLAVIVGMGKPDEEATLYVKDRPIQLLVDEEFRSMIQSENDNSA
jgi:hypothetical protein